MTSFRIPCVLLPVLALALGTSPFASAAGLTKPAPAEEPDLIALLHSGAPPADQAIACKQLALCGGKKAAAALAPLLTDPELASWARIALEAIPGPEASAALRETLGKLQGKLLVGAINSLGVRRDELATGALTGLLDSPDPEVSAAAAVALGHIGGETAAKALEARLLGSAPDSVRSAVAEGCILVAETCLTAGKPGEAARFYDAVRAANVNLQRSVEATRGAILARGAEGLPLLREQLRSPQKAYFHIGLRTARELPGAEVSRALLDELQRAAPERKPCFLLALADRRAPEALPAALEAARSGPAPLRLVAIGLLERLGDASCVAPLLAIAAEDDPGVSQAARSALTRLPGPEVDAAILASFRQTGEKARLLGIELAAQRRLTSVVPDLVKAAAESAPALRAASLKALGELGDAPELPPLIGLLLASKDTAPVESALAAIGSRMSRPAGGSVAVKKALYGDLAGGRVADVTTKVAELARTSATVRASNALFGDPAGGVVKKLAVEYTVDGVPGSQTVGENETLTFSVSSASPVFVDALTSAMVKAPAEAKPALLRVLGTAGGPRALAAVRESLHGPDAGLRDAAFGALCQWPGPEALGDLEKLVRNGADQKQKVLAMRGYMRIVSQADLAVSRKLELLNGAMAFAPRDEERKLVLGALGGVRSPQAVKLILPHLNNPALKEEACMAAVSVAENFRRGVPAPVAEAMLQVVHTTANPALAKRAEGLAAKAEKK